MDDSSATTFVISVILLGGGLITSGLLEIYFRYRESHENVNLLQQEVAAAAAFKTEQFIQQIEAALRTATKSPEIARRGTLGGVSGRTDKTPLGDACDRGGDGARPWGPHTPPGVALQSDAAGR